MAREKNRAIADQLRADAKARFMAMRRVERLAVQLSELNKDVLYDRAIFAAHEFEMATDAARMLDALWLSLGGRQELGNPK